VFDTADARRLITVDAHTSMAECRDWRRAVRWPGSCDCHGLWGPWGHGSCVAHDYRQLRGEGDRVGEEIAVRVWHGSAAGRTFSSACTTVHVCSHTFLRSGLVRHFPL